MALGRRVPVRILVLGLVSFVAAGVWLVGTGAPAQAHALVATSTPLSGSIIASPPPQVLITFTEAPDAALSSVRVLDQTGRPVTGTPARVVPGNPLQLSVPLPVLAQGVYTVAWRTVSKVDGHVTAGSFSFGVGVLPGAGGTAGGEIAVSATPNPSALAVIGRWCFYWGLALLLGAGIVGWLVLRGLPLGSRALLTGSWLLAAAGLVMMTFAERSAVGVSLGRLLSSSVGGDLVTRGFALLIPLAMVITVILRPRWESLAFLAVAAGMVLLVHTLSSHASAESPVWFNVGVQWMHLLAVGIWVGGLSWLLLGLRGAEHEDRRGAVRRFSRIAAIALAATAVSGILRAITELGGWRPLFDTSFGVALLVKVGLVGVLIGLGALNRYRNIPRMDSPNPGVRRLRRTVRWELIVAACVFAAAAVLSELPPGVFVAAAAANRPQAAAAVSVSGSDFGTTVRVTLTITPGSVGPNSFTARVVDYDTRQPVDATSVTLRFALPSRPDVAPSTLQLSRAAAGTWAASGTNLSFGGDWDVTVTVQDASGAVEVPLRVRTRA